MSRKFAVVVLAAAAFVPAALMPTAASAMRSGHSTGVGHPTQAPGGRSSFSAHAYAASGWVARYHSGGSVAAVAAIGGSAQRSNWGAQAGARWHYEYQHALDSSPRAGTLGGSATAPSYGPRPGWVDWARDRWRQTASNGPNNNAGSLGGSASGSPYQVGNPNAGSLGGGTNAPVTNNGGSRPVIADAGRWFGTSPSPLANRALVAFNFTTPPSYGVRGNSPAGAAGPSKRKYHIAGNEDGPSFSDPNDPDNNNVGVVCVIDTQHDDPNQLRGCRGFVDPRDQCSLTADNGGPQSGPGWICKADPTVTGVPDPGEPNQGLRCRDTDINLSTFTCTDFHYYGDGSEQACNVLTQQTGTDPDGSKWTCFPTTKEGGEGMVCRATSSNGPCIPTGGQCSLLYQDHEVLAKWNGQLIMCQPKPGQGDPNPPGGWSFCQNVPPDQQAALDCFGNLPPATNQPTLR